VIVGSLLLILGAVALLALGLVRGSNAYLVASIVASLLAAIALVVGSRQTGAKEAVPARARGGKRAGEDAREPAGHPHNRRDQLTEVMPAVRADGPDPGAEAAEEAPARHGAVAVQEAAIPAQAGAPDLDRGPSEQVTLDDDDDDDFDESDPPDEPVAQQVSVADAARVARMTNEVLVIDGRPRYHLPGCVHLLGRDSEPLPVQEAVELGFTPCGLCEPDSALLAEARRV
jgi:hypothetical protein